MDAADLRKSSPYRANIDTFRAQFTKSKEMFEGAMHVDMFETLKTVVDDGEPYSEIRMSSLFHWDSNRSKYNVVTTCPGAQSLFSV